MLFSYSSRYIKKHHRVWLYSTVFSGRISACLVIVLLATILIQPVNQAFAQEPEAPPEPVSVAVDVKEQTEPPTEAAALPVEETIVEQPAESEPVTVVTDQPEPTAETDIDTSGGETEPPSVVGEGGSTNSETVNDSESEAIDETQETTVDGQETKREKTNDGEVLKIESLVTEENYYQFSKQSCIGVGRGVYHCTANTDDVENTDSVVYSDRDGGGDMEIFLKTSRGKVKQLTDNDLDDLSPHYDPGAMKVVWQRLIDGRYQIMLYDIMEDKETQLTYSKTNNMEPKVSQAGIVWQAWDDHDWEIMLFDGTYTDQITDNDIQDVAPVMQDGYILWNVLGGTEQQARVYSLDTKETVTIEGHEGGSIVNPRFVLVYDTEYENGDVVTQTFDLLPVFLSRSLLRQRQRQSIYRGVTRLGKSVRLSKEKLKKMKRNLKTFLHPISLIPMVLARPFLTLVTLNYRLVHQMPSCRIALFRLAI